MNRYRATFRHKVRKDEKQVDTVAYSAQDAWIQCIVKLSGIMGGTMDDWALVDLGPHPDAVILPTFTGVKV